MDPSVLSAFLAPCLGFLLASGKAAGDRAVESLGTHVWEHAQRLWGQAHAAGAMAGGQRSVAVGGDIAHSTVVTGDHNRLGAGA